MALDMHSLPIKSFRAPGTCLYQDRGENDDEAAVIFTVKLP